MLIQALSQRLGIRIAASGPKRIVAIRRRSILGIGSGVRLARFSGARTTAEKAADRVPDGRPYRYTTTIRYVSGDWGTLSEGGREGLRCGAGHLPEKAGALLLLLLGLGLRTGGRWMGGGAGRSSLRDVGSLGCWDGAAGRASGWSCAAALLAGHFGDGLVGWVWWLMC